MEGGWEMPTKTLLLAHADAVHAAVSTEGFLERAGIKREKAWCKQFYAHTPKPSPVISLVPGQRQSPL